MSIAQDFPFFPQSPSTQALADHNIAAAVARIPAVDAARGRTVDFARVQTVADARAPTINIFTLGRMKFRRHFPTAVELD